MSNHFKNQKTIKNILFLILTVIILINYNCSFAEDSTEIEISELEKAIEANPKNWTAFNRLGILYYQKYSEYSTEDKYGYSDKFVEEAIKNYKKAIELKPNYGEAYYNLAVAYSPQSLSDYDKKRNYMKAILNLKKALELNFKKAKTNYYLGLNYFYLYRSNLGRKPEEWLMERFNKCVNYYENAIKLNSNYSDAYYAMGTAYYQKHAYDQKIETLNESIEFYEEYVKLDPDNYDVYYRLGKYYSQRGVTDKAILNYEKSVKINRETDAWYHLAFEYEKNGMYDEAIKLFEENLPSLPNRNYVHFYSTLAGLYEKKGDNKQAKYYSELIEQLKSDQFDGFW